ncbi:uncharacterized protein STEHIDRAFT_163555 [Stereum hirsutum FP-91666 SS1]|uniref:Uncharacterized protein n=1 Tax=Stereum hirsutum (strain FP-91666) TaxID=721885 RepID=R7RYX1_STEHR|nr:uncharacterized protein STEHIDRAFT_163555 [Stereum hirsutum FP-91666 SS1]EIM79517.1 hypothetical protein STEHIDRAFT_163555 [Stereum hirsutum FP-91666 SS1]
MTARTSTISPGQSWNGNDPAIVENEDKKAIAIPAGQCLKRYDPHIVLNGYQHHADYGLDIKVPIDSSVFPGITLALGCSQNDPVTGENDEQ